jgi:PAS domain S-box-containing protein
MAFSRTASDLLPTALLAAAYVVAAKLSLIFAIPPGYATAVWPPSGIALAAVLIVGPRIWPGVWLGAAVANLTVQGSPLVAGTIACGNTLEAIVAAEIIRRFAGSGRFDRVGNVVRFAGAVALAATLAAVVGIFALGLRNVLPWREMAINAWTWWQGDLAGMLVVTPLILAFRESAWPRWTAARATEAALLAAALVATSLLAFGNAFPAERLPLAFVVLPVVMWAAVRFGEGEVTVSAAFVCAIAVRGTLQGAGPWGALPPAYSLPVLLAYTATLVIVGLVLNAAMRERSGALARLHEVNAELASGIAERTRELERANETLRGEIEEHARHEEELREREERLRLIVDGVKDYAIFSLDPHGNVASWNTGAQAIKGYAADEIIGQHFSRFYPPEDLARNWPAHELEVAARDGRFEDEGWRVRKDGSRFWANVIITALRGNDGRLRGFAKVTRDLTARRRFEKLQQTERQLKEFLAMLGHELRNPLAAIVNAVALLPRARGAKHDELVAVVERQVQHVTRIVDDLLDVSRITRGIIALRNEVVDFNNVVARALEVVQPQAEARRHALDVRLSRHALAVDGDPTRLAQIAHNLLSNAVKYTPEGGVIAVTLAREADAAVLRVRDNGIGISAELLPMVFDPFVQGDHGLERAEGGLGIGLTLARRLAELHGGTVEAASDGAGKGSEFTLRLPLAHGREIAVATGPATNALAAARRRLLIVDDNRDAADTLAALLAAMGHEVRTAYDGTSGLAAAAELQPDAVFLDIGLPQMNGFDVARRIRQSPALAGATLVAFTGYGQEDDRRGARAAGFDHHLVKPVALAELAAIVEALPARA